MTLNPSQYRRPGWKIPFRLSERDVAVLRAVHKYRLLERRQIQRMFFARPGSRSANLSWTVTRLKCLYEAGLVERIQRKGWWGRATPGPVYRLAKKGAELLAQEQGMPAGQMVYWGKKDDNERRPTWVGPQYVDHAVLLAEVRILVEQAVERVGGRIEKWLDQVDLQRTWKTERVWIE